MELLQFTGTRKLRLIPISNIIFTWKKYKGRLHIAEMNVMHETSVDIDAETCKMLIKAMRKAKTDVLTDGRYFYTTTGDNTNKRVTRIEHPSFNQLLELNKELIHKLRFG